MSEHPEAQHWPRERWPEHPRFPEQALLLGSHDAFRNYVRYIRDGVEQVGREQGSTRRRQRLLSRLGEHYADLMWSMSVHERYEERKLYPFLEQRYGLSLAWLREEHDELQLLHELVGDAFAEAALHRAARDDDALEAARAQLAGALEASQTVLSAHLSAEEDAVVPLMLALPPEEFAHYRDLPQAKGPPRPRAF